MTCYLVVKKIPQPLKHSGGLAALDIVYNAG
jgi:hypothetical protein